jgi:hypothetical protein
MEASPFEKRDNKTGIGGAYGINRYNLSGE